MTEEILIKVELDKPEAEKQVTELSKSITTLTQENQKLVASNKELEKQGKANSKEHLENSKQLEINKQKIGENTSSRKNLISAIIAEDNSIKGLKVRNAELVKQRDLLSTSTESGRAAIEKINNELNKNNAIIKINSSALEQQKQNVGNYKDSIVDAAKETKVGGLSVNDLTASFTKLLNPVTGTVAVVTGLFAAYTKSAAGARDLESAQAKLGAGVSVLNNQFAKLVGADGKGGGLLSSLADAFNFAIGGVDALLVGNLASNAQNTLKEIEILDLAAKQFAKDQLTLAEEQRRIRDDESKSFDERLAAAKNVDTFINAREAELVGIQEKRLTQLQTLLALDQHNLELQKQVKQVEFEIADIREDSEGKRTEALNGIIALEKLEVDLFKAGQEEKVKARDEASQLELEGIRAKYEAEQIERELAAERELEFAQTFYGEGSDLDKVFNDFNNRRVANDAKTNADQKKGKEELTKRTLALKDQEAGAARDLSATLAGLSKKDSAGQKAFALTSIITNSAIGVSNAVKAGSGIPWPANLAAILSGITAVLAGIGQAKGILGFILGGLIPGYAGGGVSGTRIMSNHGSPINRSNGDNRIITAKTGEVILNQRQQSALGGSATFARIGVPGFATGGVIGNETRLAAGRTESQFDINRLAGLINTIQPVLVYQDFEVAQDDILSTRNRAQVI